MNFIKKIKAHRQKKNTKINRIDFPKKHLLKLAELQNAYIYCQEGKRSVAAYELWAFINKVTRATILNPKAFWCFGGTPSAPYLTNIKPND